MLLHGLFNGVVVLVVISQSIVNQQSPALGVMGVAGKDGLEIGHVEPGMPADVAGIKAGDRLISIDGQPVRNLIELKRALLQHKLGDVVEATLVRDGEERQVEVALTHTAADLANRGAKQQTEEATRP
jgi:serine protease Do